MEEEERHVREGKERVNVRVGGILLSRALRKRTLMLPRSSAWK